MGRQSLIEKQNEGCRLMRGRGEEWEALGEGRESGWTGENMRDEGYRQGLDRKCVSINITVSGSC